MADLPGCVSALQEVHVADGYPSRWPTDPAGWLSPAGLLAAWVALDDGGRVLGHVALRTASQQDAAPLRAAGVGDDLALVARLFVAPAGQGRGLGAALLAAAEAHAARLGLWAALDVVAEAQAAVRLYERAGWRRVATLPAPWQDARGEQPRMHVYLAPERAVP